jgi:hypothetical protein
MLEASGLGARIFRNNVGVATYPGGHRVAYGLCPGSSDLIGWLPYEIQQGDVGRTVAVFVALEVKAPGGRPTEGQANFLERVQGCGGLAALVRSPEDACRAIQSWKPSHPRNSR